MIKKYLTKFNNDTEYNNFIFSNDIIKPNVSSVNHQIHFGFDFSENLYTIDDIKNNSELFANCKFFYEDINKEIILNFKSLNYNEIVSFNEYNIAPYLAKYIGLYINDIRIGELNIDFLLQEFGERKYRIGLMSDVHYNDGTLDTDIGTIDYDGAEYEIDLPNALSVYQNKEDVDFVCSAGDISSNYIVHMLNFKKALETYSPTTKFYSCYGNHDFASAKNEYIPENELYDTTDMNGAQAWNEIMIPKNSDYELHYQDETTDLGKSSFWFEVPIKGTNKSDIYIFLSVNYDNNESYANKILTTESPNIQPLIDYVGFMPSQYNIQLYDNLTLIWFKNLLEQFANKRIFIFTHLFLVHKAGSNNIDNGYYHYGGIGDRWRIQPGSAYCPCGIQFEFLNKLNNEYKNTIWFGGHSHSKWNWQTIDPHININDNEYNIYRPDDNDFIEDMVYLRKSNDPISKSGFNVHIPSTCRPLRINQWYDVAGQDSEGAILDIYEDYVDVRGIVFKEESDTYINKYYPLAQYRINIKAA